MLAAHVAEGVISALEAEQLTGFLLLDGAGVELPERTARRRRERLRSWDVPTAAADRTARIASEVFAPAVLVAGLLLVVGAALLLIPAKR